jgi:hypothetical protein
LDEAHFVLVGVAYFSCRYSMSALGITGTVTLEIAKKWLMLVKEKK